MLSERCWRRGLGIQWILADSEAKRVRFALRQRTAQARQNVQEIRLEERHGPRKYLNIELPVDGLRLHE